ncbi:restriction endonuclease subunit S [Bifidobacterium criceti]
MGVEHDKLGFRPCFLIQFFYHTSNDEARPLHTNLRRAIKASDYCVSGRYPIIDQGQNAIAGYTDDATGIYENVPAIVFGDHTGVFKYVTQPFFIGADGTKVLETKDPTTEQRYLYHALRFVDLPDGGYSRHYKWLKEVAIRVPDTVLQRRIANRLDEIERLQRIAQDMLEKYDELIQSRFVEMFGSSDQEMVTLGECCMLQSGKTPSKRNADFWEHGTIPWFSPKDMKHPHLTDSQDHITEKAITDASMTVFTEPTVVVVVRGMILAHDVPIAVLSGPHVTINQDMKALIPKDAMDPTFLAEAVRNQEQLLLAETTQSAHGTYKLDAQVLVQIPIPHVQLPSQQRFAAFVEQVNQMKDATTRTLEQLQMLYDSLAQQYFAI